MFGAWVRTGLRVSLEPACTVMVRLLRMYGSLHIDTKQLPRSCDVTSYGRTGIKTGRKSTLTLALCKGIDIVVSSSRVHELIMRNVVDLVLVQPCLVDDPRRVRQDLVRPSAMSDRLASFRMRHGRRGLVLGTLQIRVHTHQQVDFRE